MNVGTQFTIPVKDGRLSWPRYCADTAVSGVECRARLCYSGCHDTYNCIQSWHLTHCSHLTTASCLWHVWRNRPEFGCPLSGETGPQLSLMLRKYRCFMEWIWSVHDWQCSHARLSLSAQLCQCFWAEFLKQTVRLYIASYVRDCCSKTWWHYSDHVWDTVYVSI